MPRGKGTAPPGQAAAGPYTVTVTVTDGGLNPAALSGDGEESGGALEIFEEARHPYTRALLAAVPRLDVDAGAPLDYIVGSPPDMTDPPVGCPFAPRCEKACARCVSQRPSLTEIEPGHLVRCWLPNLAEGAR